MSARNDYPSGKKEKKERKKKLKPKLKPDGSISP